MQRNCACRRSPRHSPDRGAQFPSPDAEAGHVCNPAGKARSPRVHRPAVMPYPMTPSWIHTAEPANLAEVESHRRPTAFGGAGNVRPTDAMASREVAKARRQYLEPPVPIAHRYRFVNLGLVNRTTADDRRHRGRDSYAGTTPPATGPVLRIQPPRRAGPGCDNASDTTS